MTKKNKVDSVSDLFVASWKPFKKHWLLLVGLFAIPFSIDLILLSTVFSDVQEAFERLNEELPAVEDLPPNFGYYLAVSLMIGVFMTIILITAQLQILRDKKPSLSELGDAALENFWRLFAVSCGVIFSVVLGLVLFVVPGIVAGFAMMFAAHASVDKKLQIMESIQLSYQKVRSNWQHALLLTLGFVGIVVAFDVATRAALAGLEGRVDDVIYSLLFLPVTAYISLVFTNAYLHFKTPKLKVDTKPSSD